MNADLLGALPDFERLLVFGTASYVALVALLLITGKRTLTKFNAFDFVITIALGSTLSSILLDKTIALAEGIAALALLVALQFVVTWLSVRSPFIRDLVKSTPTLLLSRGTFLDDAMKEQRITRDEIFAALRQQGISDVGCAFAVILETDGSISVIEGAPDKASAQDGADPLRNVERWTGGAPG